MPARCRPGSHLRPDMRSADGHMYTISLPALQAARAANFGIPPSPCRALVYDHTWRVGAASSRFGRVDRNWDAAPVEAIGPRRRPRRNRIRGRKIRDGLEIFDGKYAEILHRPRRRDCGKTTQRPSCWRKAPRRCAAHRPARGEAGTQAARSREPFTWGGQRTGAPTNCEPGSPRDARIALLGTPSGNRDIGTSHSGRIQNTFGLLSLHFGGFEQHSPCFV